MSHQCSSCRAGLPPTPTAAPRALSTPYLSVDEAADWLGISRSSLYALIRTGALRSFKVGPGRRLVSYQAIEDYVREAEAEAS